MTKDKDDDDEERNGPSRDTREKGLRGKSRSPRRREQSSRRKSPRTSEKDRKPAADAEGDHKTYCEVCGQTTLGGEYGYQQHCETSKFHKKWLYYRQGLPWHQAEARAHKEWVKQKEWPEEGDRRQRPFALSRAPTRTPGRRDRTPAPRAAAHGSRGPSKAREASVRLEVELTEVKATGAGATTAARPAAADASPPRLPVHARCAAPDPLQGSAAAKTPSGGKPTRSRRPPSPERTKQKQPRRRRRARHHPQSRPRRVTKKSLRRNPQRATTTKASPRRAPHRRQKRRQNLLRRPKKLPRKAARGEAPPAILPAGTAESKVLRHACTLCSAFTRRKPPC